MKQCGKKLIQKKFQRISVFLRNLYIYSKWDTTANRYIVP